MLSGENGIINRAGEARYVNGIAQFDERTKIAQMAVRTGIESDKVSSAEYIATKSANFEKIAQSVAKELGVTAIKGQAGNGAISKDGYTVAYYLDTPVTDTSTDGEGYIVIWYTDNSLRSSMDREKAISTYGLTDVATPANNSKNQATIVTVIKVTNYNSEISNKGLTSTTDGDSDITKTAFSETSLNGKFEFSSTVGGTGAGGSGGGNPIASPTPGVTSNLTEAETTAIATQNTKTPSDTIAEITGNAITNNYLKDTTKIKAVLTNNVPIPVNATYKEGTESTGVVIEYKNSEFVWVPVKNANGSININKMVMCTSHSESSDCDIEINAEGTGLYCKNHSSTATEIVGRLYATSAGENFNKDLTSQTYNANSGLREPAIVTGNSSGTGTNYDNSTSYNNGLFTLDSLKSEYREMALSVAKYGGFYIGRYETSIDSTTGVASKKSPVETGDTAIMPMSADTTSGDKWYGMYSKQKTFSTTGMQSSMIWGSQYDAMLLWVLTGADASHVTAKTNANHSTTVKGTGTKAEDVMNNIYDLEGNLYEWTLEANSTGYRVYRGGSYVDSSSPSCRGSIYPFNTYANLGSRLSLYIK